MTQSKTDTDTESESEHSGPDRRAVRSALRRTIRASKGSPEWDDVVAATTATVDAPARVVRDELEACEREGFVRETDDGVTLA
jgi:hypothetical protein